MLTGNLLIVKNYIFLLLLYTWIDVESISISFYFYYLINHTPIF